MRPSAYEGEHDLEGVKLSLQQNLHALYSVTVNHIITMKRLGVGTTKILEKSNMRKIVF